MSEGGGAPLLPFLCSSPAAAVSVSGAAAGFCSCVELSWAAFSAASVSAGAPASGPRPPSGAESPKQHDKASAHESPSSARPLFSTATDDSAIFRYVKGMGDTSAVDKNSPTAGLA